MAYHCLHTNTLTSYTEALAFISDSLETIGWTLHDDISSTDKIFTSTGEEGNFVNAYVRLYISTYIRIEGYMWWNNSTHTGTGKAYAHTSYNYLIVENGESLVVYGDKNIIVLWAASNSSSYSTKAFGYILPYIEGHTTASGISSGSSITVDVDSTSNLMIDSDTMIIGTETEGRDRVHISDIVSDTQIVLTSTPRSYASGAKIGYFPCPFFVTSYQYGVNDLYFQGVCGYATTGTSNVSSYGVCRYTYAGKLFSTDSQIDPDDYVNKHILQSCGYKEYTTTQGMIGYLDILKRAPTSDTSKTYYSHTLYCVNYGDPWSGVPTSTMSSGIVDIGHSWANDQFKDKIIAITSGPGLGETRKVLSNTSDTLTIGDLWVTSPTNGSTYDLYDSVYRNVYGYMCIKEIIS